MLDMVQLTELTEALEQAIFNKDIEEIQRLCMEKGDFIFSLKPQKNDIQTNQKIKHFIHIHQSATQLVQSAHRAMQNQLFQSTQTRKGVSQYKGVKHAE
ncbi:hypothetical protein [Marinomonas transparens]|uniref:Flagellar protein FliT n=1 Tax=Marinomonas transparens TaxID=2795388 RepID=A0A934JYX6_9GAMM|nr:hypothetical protein [Marinomonas transparens]MBJ7539810.1 hypothetical protein [Marinomonas transparens]